MLNISNLTELLTLKVWILSAVSSIFIKTADGKLGLSVCPKRKWQMIMSNGSGQHEH